MPDDTRTPVSRTRHPGILRWYAMLAVTVASVMLASITAIAQSVQPQDQTALRFVIETVGGQVRCSPSDVRIPPQTPLALEILNQADQALWFVAPDFFREAKVSREGERPLDRIKGGVLMPAQSKLRMMVVSPDPGRFSYSCTEVGEGPHPLSHGVVIVTSPS